MSSAAVTSVVGAPGTTSAGGRWEMDAVGPSLVVTVRAPTQARCASDRARVCRHGRRRDMDGGGCNEVLQRRRHSGQSARRIGLPDGIMQRL